MIKDLEYKVGHMEKGKGTTSFFGSGGMGKNGGLFSGGSGGGLFSGGSNGAGLFSGGSSGGGLFSTAVLSQDALDALHSDGLP